MSFLVTLFHHTVRNNYVYNARVSHHAGFNCCLVTNNCTLYFVHALIYFTPFLYCQWLLYLEYTDEDINNNNTLTIASTGVSFGITSHRQPQQ